MNDVYAWRRYSVQKNTQPILVIFLVCRGCQVRTSGDRDVRIACSGVAASALTIAFRLKKEEIVYTYERVREKECARERIGK